MTAGAEQVEDVFASFGAPCDQCGHPIGEHAAWKDRDLGGWPCLVDGCTCVEEFS